ncbi:MAG: hypothetical protein WC606_00165 [Candidatus Absconditabacterales bacterium]
MKPQSLEEDKKAILKSLQHILIVQKNLSTFDKNGILNIMEALYLYTYPASNGGLID